MTQPQVPSTMSFADLYGYRTPGNKNANDSPDTQKASGNTGAVLTSKPSYIWVAMIGMLVIARILWEKGS